MESKERPDEAGLWQREGKFYRVWFDGHYDRIQSIDAHNGFSGDRNYLKHENTPLGNWRKLAPEPVTNEAARASEFMECETCNAKPGTPLLCCGCLHNRSLIARQSDEIEELKAERDQLHKTRESLEWEVKRFEDGITASINAKISKVHPEEIKAARDRLKHSRLQQAKMGLRQFAEHCGLLPSRYCDFEHGNGELNVAEVMAVVANLPAPEPEVIEGRGQAVTKEQEGYWIHENPDGTSAMCKKKAGDVFHAGRRWMKRPTFPPRKPAFVPPEKPAPIVYENLYRTDDGVYTWQPKNFDAPAYWKLIDPTTGEPINEGAEK